LGNKATQADDITRPNPQSLIRLRYQADRLLLQNSRIHARQGGAYLSSFKGRGMEYEESRLYLPGDDIRSMDWRVTARTGDPHTKVFREERERPVLLWLDLNPSMMFATRGAYKAVIASQAAALLGWSTNAHNDRLGALLFADGQHTELRPRRGKSAVLDLIGRICNHPAWSSNSQQGASTLSAMTRLRKVAHPGSLIFLLSDFHDLDANSRTQLTSIARHNDVVLIQFYDPLEAELPPPGVYKVSDGKRLLRFSSVNESVRRDYHQRFLQRQLDLSKLCRQHRMYFFSIATNEDVLASLQQGLGIRATQKTQFRAARR
jgi:uncharacterized protein (DUF58 family)